MVDAIIIGAGLAGATAAVVLDKLGCRVILIDSIKTYPDSFKAEKIEEDQAALLRKFGLLEPLMPAAGRIRAVANAHRGRVLYAQQLEQYGILYHDMVNIIRDLIPPSVEFKIGRVDKVSNSQEVQKVVLRGGEELQSRIVVIASGTSEHLCRDLGIQRRVICSHQSFAIGFNIEPTQAESFPFDGLTYYPIGTGSGIAYLTLFLIGRKMRANLFTFLEGGDEWTRRFIRQPDQTLAESLPGLVKTIGPFRTTGKVECANINLYVTEGYRLPGVVLIGDAFQSVCPTTGTGLSRVLTDVDTLAECMPGWLRTPGMGVDKINMYYDHPRKIAVDRSSLNQALYSREVGTSKTKRWLARQVRLYANSLLWRLSPKAGH